MATASSLVPRIIRRTQFRTTTSTPPMPVRPTSDDAALPARNLTASHPESAAPFVPVAPAPAAPARVNIVAHAVAQHAFTVLSNPETSHSEFRNTCRQLLVVLLLDALRSLPTRPHPIDGTRKNLPGVTLAKPVVLLSATRAGLGLSQFALDCIPGLMAGTVSLDRPDGTAAPFPRMHLSNAPALAGARVILFDPVVQSGNAAGAALDFVRQVGATDISLLSFSIASQGLLRLQSNWIDHSVWTAHVDSDWDAKRNSGSVFGDFSARLFAG